jgi:hypothetical protein
MDTKQYFTSDSRAGRVRYGSIHWRIAVDSSPNNHQRIGDAMEVGMTTTGLAMWRLRVGRSEVPGLWILINGQFVPLEEVKDE